MKIINLFIQTKNNHLTDASAKLINYFISIKDQFVDHSCHIYHFVQQPNQVVQSVDINGIDKYYTVEYSDDNLCGEFQELEILFNSIEQTRNSKYLFAKSTCFEKLAAVVSIKFSIPLITNVVNISNNELSKEIFSGKARANITCESSTWAIILSKSLSSSTEIDFKDHVVSKIVLGSNNSYKIIHMNKISNTIPLPDAKIVVGAGRGLKDPSNWGMIEELALKLGAATACSKPVSDLNWRPHHEHVGQTGVKISPKLYIACGISGAIQHLAGVNNSGKIVVINNDQEAPFFKNADYGIVGDVFDIVPRLLKKLN